MGVFFFPYGGLDSEVLQGWSGRQMGLDAAAGRRASYRMPSLIRSGGVIGARY